MQPFAKDARVPGDLRNKNVDALSNPNTVSYTDCLTSNTTYV